MGYKLPVLDWLVVETENVDAALADVLERFPPPEKEEYKTFLEKCVNLPQAYKNAVAKTNEGGSSKPSFFSSWIPTFVKNSEVNPTRVEQAEVISFLAGILPKYSAGNRLIILGALFHRLLRLEVEHNESYTGNWPENTHLYPLLADILGVKVDKENHKAQVDALTVWQCLRGFYDYVKQKEVQDSINYIKKDYDFFINLEAMISNYERKSRLEHKQLDYVLSLKLLGKQIRVCYDNALICLELISKNLLADGPVNKLNLLEKTAGLKAALCSTMSESEAEAAIQYLAQCWPKDSEISVENREECLVEMTGLIEGNTCYVFLGLLYEAKTIAETINVKVIIEYIMNCKPSNPIDITNEDDYEVIETGLVFFKHFLSILPPYLKDLKFGEYQNIDELSRGVGNRIKFLGKETEESSDFRMAM